jgi:hypothetical protein
MMALTKSDQRIFGLLIFALVASSSLWFGLSAANVEGTILGIQVFIAGPVGAFAGLVLIFRLIGLFTIGLKELAISKWTSRKMKKEQIEEALERLEMYAKRIRRRKDELTSMRQALLQDSENYNAASTAGGFRPVQRPSG